MEQVNQVHHIQLFSQTQLLTPAEACRLLSISPQTLRRYEKEGLLSAVRTRPEKGHRRIALSEVQRLLDERSYPKPTPEFSAEDLASFAEKEPPKLIAPREQTMAQFAKLLSVYSDDDVDV
jgi:excisionase family DNA binding protein